MKHFAAQSDLRGGPIEMRMLRETSGYTDSFCVGHSDDVNYKRGMEFTCKNLGVVPGIYIELCFRLCGHKLHLNVSLSNIEFSRRLHDKHNRNFICLKEFLERQFWYRMFVSSIN